MVSFPGGRSLYDGIIRNHLIPAFGNLALCELKAPAIQKFLAEKQRTLSSRTAQIVRNVLGKSLKNAVKLGVLAKNPVDSTDNPKIIRHKFNLINENQLAVITEALKNSEYYIYFLTLLHTGLRRSEALALKWGDADLDLMTLSVSKSLSSVKSEDPEERLILKSTKTVKGNRLISLTPTNCIELRKHAKTENEQRSKLGMKPLSDNDFIFAHWDGKPFYPTSITRHWIRLMNRLGFKGVRLHDLRHTHASIWLALGIHPKIVQERLGHSSIAITLDLYSHVVPGLQEASALKFDEAMSRKKGYPKIPQK